MPSPETLRHHPESWPQEQILSIFAQENKHSATAVEIIEWINSGREEPIDEDLIISVLLKMVADAILISGKLDGKRVFVPNVKNFAFIRD